MKLISTTGTSLLNRVLVRFGVKTQPDDELDDQLDHHSKILRAVRNSDYQRTKKLLGRTPEAVETAGHLGRRPLHIAAEKGDAEMIKLLIAAGADVNGQRIEKENSRLDTPLFWAANSVIAQQLVDAGADIYATDSSGRQPIHWASQFAKPGIIKFLLKLGASVNSRNNNGDTPLHWLVGASGDSFVHINSISGPNHLQCAELLLKYGAEVNAANSYGMTPLHGLCTMPEQEREGLDGTIITLDPDIPPTIFSIVTRLLEYGADPTLKSNDGFCPLELADEPIYSQLLTFCENPNGDNSPQRPKILTSLRFQVDARRIIKHYRNVAYERMHNPAYSSGMTNVGSDMQKGVSTAERHLDNFNATDNYGENCAQLSAEMENARGAFELAHVDHEGYGTGTLGQIAKEIRELPNK